MSSSLERKNSIVLCELFHRAIHGRPEKENKEVYMHWLVIDNFNNIFPFSEPNNGFNIDVDDLTDTESDNESDAESDADTDNETDSESDSENDTDNNDDTFLLNDVIEIHKAKYISYLESNQHNFKKHPFIKNYVNIVSKPYYIQPHIAQVININNNNDNMYYSVAIIKTFWLRLVQRNWKRVYSEKKRILRLRYNPISLFYRALYGKWPSNSLHEPSLIGMLNNL